jgi:pSer/pThr/pTyr-binding forkhead associated (FHA) protein
MSSALDLIVLNGPREADVVQLKPTHPLRLGRSIKGFQLVDPLVSLTHAEVAWEGDRYWVEDLGSATGTFVNDVRLTDKPVVVVAGMRIRLGETILEVRHRPKSTLLRGLGVAAALFLVFFAYDTYRRSISVEYQPHLVWYRSVNQGAGVSSNNIDVPTSFIRETGVDHRGLKIDDVTDYDEDGIDELWLKWDVGLGGRRIVTFDDAGDWMTIGEVPLACKPRARSLAEGLPAECYLDASRVRTALPEICRRSTNKTGFSRPRL